MTVYLLEHEGKWFSTADTTTEAAELAKRLLLPATARKMTGTPRWHWVIPAEDWQWALKMPGMTVRLVDLATFRALVAARTPAAGTQPPVPATAPAAQPVRRDPAARRYNPQLQRHFWSKGEPHWRHCNWCGMSVQNRAAQSGSWYQEWTWPAPLREGQHNGNTLGKRKLPSCPGPPSVTG